MNTHRSLNMICYLFCAGILTLAVGCVPPPHHNGWNTYNDGRDYHHSEYRHPEPEHRTVIVNNPQPPVQNRIIINERRNDVRPQPQIHHDSRNQHEQRVIRENRHNERKHFESKKQSQRREEYRNDNRPQDERSMERPNGDRPRP